MEKIDNIEVLNPYGFIYITTNLVNGKRYLGQKRFDDKWKWYLGSGKAFKAALDLYKKENFHRDIIHICYSKEELNNAEYELSVFLDVVEDDNWYNMVYGGGSTTGWHHSEEAKRKVGDANRNQPEETRRKQSESAKARCTDEWKKKMVEINKTHRSNEKKPNDNVKKPIKKRYNVKSEKTKRSWAGENNPNYGNHSWAGDNNPRHKNPLRGIENGRARSVIQLTKNLQFVKRWDYISEAANFLGKGMENIVSCCKYKIPSAYGYIWVYEEDYLNNEYLNKLYANKKQLDKMIDV